MTLRRRYLVLVGAAMVAFVLATSLFLRFSILTPSDLNLEILSGLGLGGVLLVWIGGLALDARFQSRTRDLAAALSDASEQLRRQREEWERQRDEMSAIIDSIAEGVIALTKDARILRMNASAAELLEVLPPSTPAPIGTLVRHPELRAHLQESVLRPLAPLEIRVRGRYLLISSHLMREGGSVVTFLDVTRLRHMEQVRRDFVANASHELKTPLTAVRGFAETLLEEEPPGDLKQKFLEAIRDNTIRLQNLVDDLLDLSLVESGEGRLTQEEIEIGGFAREVWKGLHSDQHAERVDFKIVGDALVRTDGQALHQIFRNLFENALRYTPEGGKIRVRITRDAALVRVSIADTGAGIASSALPRIFERFYRVDAGRGRGMGGTGLGLAIVRHAVESMGGEVEAESELGRGTTIHFTLPVASDEGAENEPI